MEVELVVRAPVVLMGLADSDTVVECQAMAGDWYRRCGRSGTFAGRRVEALLVLTTRIAAQHLAMDFQIGLMLFSAVFTPVQRMGLACQGIPE